MIDKDQVIKIAKELVSIDSQSPMTSEANVAQFIFDYLKELGLKPEKQVFDQTKNRFNVLVFGSNNANLMINGHLDTVPINDPKNWTRNPFGEIADNKLYGRGSCDTKGNIACLLAAMAENFNEHIVYAFNVEEEITLGGIKKVLELRTSKLKTVKYSISLEPTDGKIIMGNKGCLIFEVFARGKTAHASQPELGENAVYKMARIIPKIEEYNQRLHAATHPVFGHASASLGIIEGGTASNVVPDLARIEIDRRVLPNENIEAIERDFKKLVSPLETKTKKRIDPAETPVNSKIVKEIQALLAGFGMDNKAYGYTATSELSEIRKCGIEGIVFGTAELGQAHVPDEYMTLEQLKTGTRILSTLLKTWR